MMRILSRSAKQKKGLTLLELLITTSMLLVVGLAVYSSLNNGIKIWKRVNCPAPEEDIYVFFEKLTRELRSCAAYSLIRFEGESDRIGFAAIVTSTINGEAQKTIGRVSYFLDGSESALNRRQDDYSIVSQGKTVSDAGKLASNVKSLSFKYYYFDPIGNDYEWVSSWDEDMYKESKVKLPLAVRVEVEFEKGSNTYDLEKTISLPQGG